MAEIWLTRHSTPEWKRPWRQVWIVEDGKVTVVTLEPARIGGSDFVSAAVHDGPWAGKTAQQIRERLLGPQWNLAFATPFRDLDVAKGFRARCLAFVALAKQYPNGRPPFTAR